MNPAGRPKKKARIRAVGFDFRTDKKHRGHAPPVFFQEALATLRNDPVLNEARVAAGRPALYLVGGVLRNLALGRPMPPDYDFVYAGKTAALAQRLARRLRGTAFILDKENLSYRIAARHGGAPRTIDISPIKGGDISSDLKKRDFTADAFALCIRELFIEDRPRLLDARGGLEDARRRLLRMTSEDVFVDDPLRCLRAVRLALQYALKITPDTAVAVKKASGLLAGVAPERIREELAAIFRCRGSSRAMEALYELGIIRAIMPEALNWRDVEGYDLLAHSLKTLDEAEAVLDEATGAGHKAFPALGEGLSGYFSGSLGPLDRKVFFKMAAFFHDIGKPATIERKNGVLSFTGHDREGGLLINGIFKRLRFSNRAAAEMANLVKNHHRLFALARLKERSDRARAHLIRAVEGVDARRRGAAVDLLLLSLADARATRGGEDRALHRLVNELLRFYFEVFLKKRPKPLMSGRDIMKIFKIPEGPLVGEIMKKVAEGVEAGAVKDKKEAAAYVRQWLHVGKMEV